MVTCTSPTSFDPVAPLELPFQTANPLSPCFWAQQPPSANGEPLLSAGQEELSVRKESSIPANRSKARNRVEGARVTSDRLEEAEQNRELVVALKACADQKDLFKGSRLHDDACRKGLLQKDHKVANGVINMYAKCGALEKAQEVLNALPMQDVVSWNALIAGYAQYGHGKEAIVCFEQMQCRGFTPTAVTLVCILKACGSIGDLETGQQVHARIIQDGLLEINLVVANALMDMYAKCGFLLKAEEIFDQLQTFSVISWNTLINGYIQHDNPEQALICLDQMRTEGFSPTCATFVAALKACGIQKALSKGQELHAEIVREGLCEANLIVGTALIDMYANCGMLLEAQNVFDGLEVSDVVSWTALITGYAQSNYGQKALVWFQQMQVKGLSPNSVTYTGALKACGSIKDSTMGRDLHAQILKFGLLERDFVSVSALIDMYATVGMLERAETLFDEVRVRDVHLWNFMIGGYAQHDHPEEALVSFVGMLSEGFHPNAASYSCALKACGSLGSACKGQELHNDVVMYGILSADVVIGTALVDMYANCGMLPEAQKVFELLSPRDRIAWNAILVGYAEFGKVDVVVDLLNKMMEEGIQPNHVTFNIILNACSHRGHVSMGQIYLEILSDEYGVTPTLEHFCCIIDLFGRAGQLQMAAMIMERLSLPLNSTMWRSFLNACILQEHLELVDWAFYEALQSNARDSASCIGIMDILCVATQMEDERV